MIQMLLIYFWVLRVGQMKEQSQVIQVLCYSQQQLKIRNRFKVSQSLLL